MRTFLVAGALALGPLVDRYGPRLIVGGAFATAAISVRVIGLAGSLILIYLTVGALSLFWIDLSIRDPISHFNYHSQLEGDMLRALPDVSDGNAEVT